MLHFHPFSVQIFSNVHVYSLLDKLVNANFLHTKYVGCFSCACVCSEKTTLHDFIPLKVTESCLIIPNMVYFGDYVVHLLKDVYSRIVDVRL